jgi:hypothetical protein
VDNLPDQVIGLQNLAAHSQWDEIKLGDVAAVILFTRELMSAHLG